MGTADSPYIIEGWDINASTDWGIDIEDVDAYFIVRGCYIHDGASGYDGIDLVSCANGVLDSNNCTDNYDGIYIGSSSDIIVINNSCNSNEMNGIDVEDSSGILIEDNECSYSAAGSGIYLYSSSGNTVGRNNCSYSADGDGIDLATSCSNNLVFGNTCSWNHWDGIWLNDSDGNTISYNDCYNSDLGAGVELENSSLNVILGNNCSYSANGDGIDLSTSYNNTIVGNDCTWNLWSGIWLNDSDGNTIDGNDCSHSNLGACIELESSSFNVITNNNCSYSANDDGINLWLHCDNNTISRNNCSWSQWDGIWLDFSDNNTISYNDCYNSDLGAGVELDNSSFNVITNNNCSYSANGDGIDLSTSYNNTIVGNDCTWNGYGGIWFNASSDNTIDGNNCSNNALEGIELDLSSNSNTINGNLCKWNGGNGTYIWDSSNNTVSGNNCSWNVKYGVFIEESSNDNMIDGNLCKWNGESGIYLWDSNNNTVSRNNCSWNVKDGVFIEESNDGNEIFFNQLVGNTKFGVEIKDSLKNLVWNNTFLGNNGAGTTYAAAHAQGRNTDTDNFWNTTGGIGNYWSDWQGRDFNGDEIQDAPYNTSGNANAKDFYPLGKIPDSTPPTTTASLVGTVGTNGWFISVVTINLSAADNAGGVGLNATYYRIGTSGGWTVFSSPFIVSTEGTTTVQFYSIDNASNDEDVKSVLIDIDLTPPDTTCNTSGTLGANGWHTSAVNVLLLPSDPAPGSGINCTKYRVDGGSWTNYTAPFGVSADGTHLLVEFYSVDNASNVGGTNSTAFKIDATLPSGTIDIQGGAAYTNKTNVNLTLQASDATSGVEKFRCSNDGTTWGSWESWQNLSDSFSWSLEAGEGLKAVFFQVMDNASNVLTCNATITLDTTPPVVSFELTSGAELGSSTATINWSATDANGVSLFEYSLDGGAFTPCGNETHADLSGLTDGSHTLTVRATDVAGNSGNATLSFKVTTSSPFIDGYSPLPLLAIIIAAVVAALLIFMLMKRRRKDEEEEAEPATAPAAAVAPPVVARIAEAPTQAAPKPTCPRCGREVAWLEKYQKFNCYSCQAYFTPDQVKPPT
jgi:parallel beta-helix repeat protein